MTDVTDGHEQVNPAVFPIELGAAFFSLTEPLEGEAFAYNRWYERDHFYAGGRKNPYVIAGRRYFATRDLRELRYAAEPNPVVPDADTGSFLHLYWIVAGGKELWHQVGTQAFADLNAAGRMQLDNRLAIHTLAPDFGWSSNRDEDGVPAELALDHPFPAVVLTTATAEGHGDLETLDRWYREVHAPTLLREGSPVALCACFIPRNLPAFPWLGLFAPEEAGPDLRLMHFWFLDEAVTPELWASTFADEAKAVADGGHGRLEFASAFKPAVPGTDRYIDEL